MQKTKTAVRIMAFVGIVGFIAWLTFPTKVMAHCDTLDGLVLAEAKADLEKGDVTPVLKWIKKEHEDATKAAFS